MIQKLQSIINPNHPIEFPAVENPFLLDVMRSCLRRDPKKRPTIPELLEHPFLRPDAVMAKLRGLSWLCLIQSN
jgi:serine/threonine-protein kinase TTK/MPS1